MPIISHINCLISVKLFLSEAPLHQKATKDIECFHILATINNNIVFSLRRVRVLFIIASVISEQVILRRLYVVE